MWAEWGFRLKAKSTALILRDVTEGGMELSLKTRCVQAGSTGRGLKMCTVDKQERDKFTLDM